MAFRSNRFALLEGVADEVEDVNRFPAEEPSSVAAMFNGNGKKPPQTLIRRFTAEEPSSVAEKRNVNDQKPFDHGFPMENHERNEATQLPDVIIQYIQSFLDVKQAARTSIISKSWYEAWLTRPDLEFVEEIFPHKSPSSGSAFIRFVEKTLQRYDSLDLKIHRFKLHCLDKQISQISVASKWIQKAMKLGATDLDIRFSWAQSNTNIMPSEVLESESLVSLSLTNGRIDVLDQKVNCSRLKCFKLHNVIIEGNNIWDILWMCPLIEEFELCHCAGSYCNATRDLSGRGTLLLKPRLGVNDFHRLKVLFLEWVEICEWFFHDLSSKFPFLKELRLRYCRCHKEIQICSNSLESIIFHFLYSEHAETYGYKTLRIKLDVPLLREYKICTPSPRSYSRYYSRIVGTVNSREL